MTAALSMLNKLAIEDVLVREDDTARHNLICGNIFAALHRHLCGASDQVFMSVMKVKPWPQLHLAYHPDVVVACGPNNQNDRSISCRKAIIEIVSESTRSTDAREKLVSYLQIVSLEEYVLIEQSMMYFIIYRRSNNWMPEQCVSMEALLPLPSLGFSMPLSEVYEGVTFSA